MLPDVSGLDVMKEVRTATSSIPILMVTARGEDPDVIVGLELGADDYLVKPVSLRQLSARVRAVLRRVNPQPEPSDIATFGPLSINFLAHTVTVDDDEIALTAMEFKILAVLARHPNRVFSRLQLMESAFEDYYEGYERTIDSHVSRIRTKLGLKSIIQTVYGSGYKLVPEGVDRHDTISSR
jgi:DNA-binding response OmpR family regulator